MGYLRKSRMCSELGIPQQEPALDRDSNLNPTVLWFGSSSDVIQFSLLCAVKLQPSHQQRAPSTFTVGRNALQAGQCKWEKLQIWPWIKNPSIFVEEKSLPVLKTDHFSKKVFVSVYIKWHCLNSRIRVSIMFMLTVTHCEVILQRNQGAGQLLV